MWGRLVNHSITRGQLSIAGCVRASSSWLCLVSLILPSELQSIQRCQVCAKLRLTVKVRWAIIARSIDTHAFLPWRLLSIELVTVWRGFDSLRGFGGGGGKEGPLMTEIHIFLFSFFPPNSSSNSAQQKALHLFSRGLGEGKGH